MNYRILTKIRNAILLVLVLYIAFLTLKAKSPYFYLMGQKAGAVVVTHDVIRKLNPVELKKYHWIVVLAKGQFALPLLVTGLVADILIIFVRQQEKNRILIFSTICYLLSLWIFYPAIPLLIHIIGT